MAEGKSIIGEVHTMLTSGNPTRASNIMKVRREDTDMYTEYRYKGKGTEQDIALIGVAVASLDLGVVPIADV